MCQKKSQKHTRLNKASLLCVHSRSVVTATEMLWLSCVLAALLSTANSNSHKGLFCVNDFVNNVSCTWNSSAAAGGPGADCWIHVSVENWIRENGKRQLKIIMVSCKLQQQGVSLSGCSVVFENRTFHYFDLSNISLECDGKFVENITDYKVQEHIKMNPPEAPNVISTTNDTWMSWNLGAPRSLLIKEFDFQTQAKCGNQTWKAAYNLFRSEQQVRTSSEQLRGRCQARVRVKARKRLNSHWSDWSPTTSWTGPMDASQNEDGLSPVTLAVKLSSVLLVVLIICTICVSKRHLKLKPLPNPSKYFLPVQSDHGGNLKNWLNPLLVSDSFTVQSCDHISPVELCSGSEVEPPTSPSTGSTSVLLQTTDVPSTASDRSVVVGENSSSSSSSSSTSSSSSCFSNMGYFLSSSSGSGAHLTPTDPSAAYCTYQDEVHKPPRGHTLHLTLCPSSSFSSSTYERLKREPQSPDSGFDFTQESEGDLQEENEDVLGDVLKHRPLFFASSTGFTSTAVAPAQPPTLPQVCSEELLDADDDDDDGDEDGDEDGEPIPAASVNYAAWPVADTTCRPSSVPLEVCKPGYLTLKELQTTFRNKSL
uniref:Interleukin-2 receptor subunit beta n=1 Tax=Cynoglossus semilaevis TaxID=244447 RepID=A0A3P8V8W9_CYNSE